MIEEDCQHDGVICSKGGHCCFHTCPGSYGGSRGDTYDESRCCKCGTAKLTGYENDRR